MATLTKGKTFTSGETVEPLDLHNLVDLATVSNIVNADIDDAAAIAGSKLAAGALGTTQLADDAVSAAKLDGVADLATKTADYTLVLGDAGRVIDMNAATDATVTVPTNASVAFATGSTVIIARRGAGEITVAGATGVSIRSTTSTFSSVTADASTNVVTVTGSAFVSGQIVRFTSLTGGAGLSTNTDYFVISPSTTTFKLSATSGGSEIDITSNITAAILLANTKRIGVQNAAVALVKVATDEWMLLGNLKS